MTSMPLSLFGIALAVAVVNMIVAIALLSREVNDHRLSERVRGASLGTSGGPARRNMADVGSAALRLLDLAGAVRVFASPKDKAQMERMMVPLGVPAQLAAPLLAAGKMVFLLGCPGAALAYHVLVAPEGSLVMHMMPGIAAGVLIPNFLMTQLRKRHLATLNRAMADTLDLLVVCAEAGLGLESAIDRVAADLRRACPAMAMEFAQLGQEMRLLPDRSVAMERFAERAEVEGLRRLAATLAQAIRYGTPLGQAMRALSADQRQDRLTRLEEKAQKLPSLLVVPLICFILPPLFIILVGPSLLQLFDAFGSI